MGGGHFNGKNHGGEHTGDGKKQKGLTAQMGSVQILVFHI